MCENGSTHNTDRQISPGAKKKAKERNMGFAFNEKLTKVIVMIK